MMEAPRTLLAELEKLVPGGISTRVSLADISRWKIGGIADVIIRPESSEQVQALRQYFYGNGVHHIVIGMTSNLLFSDEGLRVPCVQIGSRMGKVNILDGVVQAQAGAWVPGLARKIQKAGLTGAEHICGIPGTIGGLICMNGGSQRKGIDSSVLDITSVDEAGNLRVRTADQCQFAYRESVFQRNCEIIVNAALRYEKASDPKIVRREMVNILSSRRRKFPQKLPNCGSVFKSDPALYDQYGTPGAIIEKLGFKGFRIGGAAVPDVHANFIVNEGNASASDVTSIIRLIKLAAEDKLGVSLAVEACYINQHAQVEYL
jgi:UDP-N-acetylmuramate dehydrogenase